MLVAFLERGPGPGGQVAVARAIEEHPGLDGKQPALARQDGRRDLARLRLDRDQVRLEQKLDFRLQQQIVVHPLEHFGPDGHVAAGPRAAVWP